VPYSDTPISVIVGAMVRGPMNLRRIPTRPNRPIATSKRDARIIAPWSSLIRVIQVISSPLGSTSPSADDVMFKSFDRLVELPVLLNKDPPPARQDIINNLYYKLKGIPQQYVGLQLLNVWVNVLMIWKQISSQAANKQPENY